MKKLLIGMILCSFLVSVQAQKISFQAVTGLGAALSFGELPAYGISVAAEPKIFIGNNIAAGLRMEGDVLIGGNIDAQNAANMSVGLSSRVLIGIKGEYYFTDMKVRPYVGFGVGRFAQANIGASGTGEVAVAAISAIGVSPELGLALGNFRLSALYHVVPGKDLVTIEVGDVREVSRNYLVLQMSWKLFGIGRN